MFTNSVPNSKLNWSPYKRKLINAVQRNGHCVFSEQFETQKNSIMMEECRVMEFENYKYTVSKIQVIEY
jgi:hypothetical protein